MKVTIITVCFNAAANLAETIESVVGQTYGDIEYIIIDGGSTDGSLDIINRYASQISYWISEPDKGIYDAMNKGIAHSHGDYILFLNSGDLFFNNNVIAEVMAKVADSPVRPDVIYGETIGNKGGGKYMHLTISPEPFTNDLGCCHQSILTSGEIMRRHKFDTRYKLMADFAYMHRLHQDKRNVFMHVKRYISIYDYTGVSSLWKYRRMLRCEQLDITGQKHTQASVTLWLAKIFVKSMLFKLLPMKIEHRLRKFPELQPLHKFRQFDD